MGVEDPPILYGTITKIVTIKSTQTEKILYKPKPKKIPKPSKEDWYVYLVQCNDNTLYTGVTNNLQKRMDTHAKGKGSKYIKAKGFNKLINFKKCKSKSDAQKTECFIKKLHKLEKINWFHQNR